jgi:hypothetical protein
MMSALSGRSLALVPASCQSQVSAGFGSHRVDSDDGYYKPVAARDGVRARP